MRVSKIAIMTDSNSGITQQKAKEMGIYVLPMPFYVNGETKYEDLDLTQEEFYRCLEAGAEIATSQPAVGDVLDAWEGLLKEYDAVVHIPMSSSLSSSYETAAMLAADFDGRVQVVNNQRISITLVHAIYQAMELAQKGVSAEEIKRILEETKADSSIYITLETLKYLKKGGRITPAAAAFGELLRLKPVLQIQGGKLDAFSKARTKKMAKAIMIKAIKNDCVTRFGSDERGTGMMLAIAYSGDNKEALEFLEEVRAEFPGLEIPVAPLSLSIACHIGPGAVALACSKRLPE